MSRQSGNDLGNGERVTGDAASDPVASGPCRIGGRRIPEAQRTSFDRVFEQRLSQTSDRGGVEGGAGIESKQEIGEQVDAIRLRTMVARQLGQQGGAMAGGVAGVKPEAKPAAEPIAEGKGYQETEHVRRYYGTTRI